MITWIYNNTSSVFWIIVLHGWNNTIQSYLVLSAGLLANVIFAVASLGGRDLRVEEVRQPDAARQAGGDGGGARSRLTRHDTCWSRRAARPTS